MPASKHQLAASAYHIRPADMRKLLLAATHFRDCCLIKTLWWLGVRRSELIQLDVRDLDVERKRVTVQKGQGSKTRVIPQSSDEKSQHDSGTRSASFYAPDEVAIYDPALMAVRKPLLWYHPMR